MLRASIMLASIPLIMFVVAGTSKPQPIIPVAVTTEAVRKIDMDTRTFKARWRPVNDIPPAIEIHEVRSVREDVASAVTGAMKIAPQPVPPSRHRLRSRPAQLDLCGKHGLRKIYTRGGKSWRCRR
jgi:hypothetical protein